MNLLGILEAAKTLSSPFVLEEKVSKRIEAQANMFYSYSKNMHFAKNLLTSWHIRDASLSPCSPCPI